MRKRYPRGPWLPSEDFVYLSGPRGALRKSDNRNLPHQTLPTFPAAQRSQVSSSPILPGPSRTQMPAELPRTRKPIRPPETVISPPVTASR